MRTSILALIFIFVTISHCFVPVQTIDELRSFSQVLITLDGSTSGSASAAFDAQGSEYIIPGNNYPTPNANEDQREIFLSSTISNVNNGVDISTFTENGSWNILFPNTGNDNPVYQAILTYDGNSGFANDSSVYDYNGLQSLDLTNPRSFTGISNQPPAYGFQLEATSDLVSTFSFRVITSSTRGSELIVSLPAQNSAVSVFAPFYQFVAIPAGDPGFGQHPTMSGQPADFTDVNIVSFIFEIDDAVDASLSFVSLIVATISGRVYRDCTGPFCSFGVADTVEAGVIVRIDGSDSSNAGFTGFVTTDNNGEYKFFVDEGNYQVCLDTSTLPSGVTLSTCGISACQIAQPRIGGAFGNFSSDVIIDYPVVAELGLQAPPPTTVNCGPTAATTAPTSGTATASGCGVVPQPTFFDVTTPNCDGAYTILRTWSVSQNSNTRTVTQVISVVDRIAPVISTNFVVGVLDCNQCRTTAQTCLSVPSITDNCASNIVNQRTFDDATTGNSCRTTLTRTWRATDPCGNTATPVAQVVTFVDTTNPTFVFVPPAGTVPCGSTFVFGSASANDNCNQVAITSFDVDLTGSSCTTSRRRVFVADDGCGNSVTASQTLTAAAAGTPSLTVPPSLPAVPCTSSLTPTALNSFATATDSCTNAALQTTFRDVGSAFSNPPHQLGSSCTSSFTRIWTVSNACGDTITGAQIITVTDNTLPTFTNVVTSPPPTQCGSTGALTAPVPSSTDSCSTVTQTFSDQNLVSSCVTTVQRTWTASDACFNSVSTTQFIVRVDSSAPIITLPTSQVVVACPESTSPTAGNTPTTSDCQINVALTSFDVTVSVTACESRYNRIWTADDRCGNTATVSQSIVSRDITAPTFSSFPLGRTVDCSDLPTATSVNVSGSPNPSDLCNPATVSFSDASTGSFCPNGVQLTRTWVVTDDCGLRSSSAQLITITNLQPPTISITPTTTSVSCDLPSGTDVTGTAVNGASCGIASEITVFDVSSTVGCQTVITRTFVVTDQCDRTATTSQLINRPDTVPPFFITFPDDVEISCAVTDTEISTGTPTVGDNCDVSPTLAFSDVISQGTIGPGLCPGDDVTTRTWTVTDACGLSSRRVQTITTINRPPDECDPVACLPQACDSSSCPVPNCDCCGAAAVNCLPVNCTPQPCTSVDCSPVPCSGCDIDIAVTGCQPRTCPPRYVYVDDDDIENFQKAQPAQQANPKVSGASQLVLSCMLLLASVGSIFVALF